MKHKNGFIDTNIFIEVFARKGERGLACAKFLKEATSLWTTELVVAETEWVLRSGYQETRERVVSCLKQILGSDNIKIGNKKVLLEALALYADFNIDFTDCINAAFVKYSNIAEVYSFDKHFDKFPGIKRLEPSLL